MPRILRSPRSKSFRLENVSVPKKMARDERRRHPRRTKVRLGSIAPLWPSVDYFRSFPGNGHCQGRSPCLKGANSSHGTHPELEATVAEKSATDVA